MLKEILKTKYLQVEKLSKVRSIASFELEGKGFKKRNFLDKLLTKRDLNELGIIAEVKKASPSKGVLRQNFVVEKIQTNQ